MWDVGAGPRELQVVLGLPLAWTGTAFDRTAGNVTVSGKLWGSCNLKAQETELWLGSVEERLAYWGHQDLWPWAQSINIFVSRIHFHQRTPLVGEALNSEVDTKPEAGDVSQPPALVTTAPSST